MNSSDFIAGFIAEQQLPQAFRQVAENHYQPLGQWLVDRHRRHGNTLVVGINGSQGSGKSTLAAFLLQWLRENAGLHAVCLSIDDLYLTRQQRTALAQRVHPLLQTRGVPGTHDTDLGIEIIEALKSLRAGQQQSIPRFDKANDDRADASAWSTIEGPVDIILFEGWCVGSLAQNEAELQTPVNALEADEDAAGHWRQYVNTQLAGPYRQLFALLDCLVMLKAPDFDCVYRWRLEQEQKLAQRSSGSQIMNAQQIQRFIQHYQRITGANLATLPPAADVLLTLDIQHQVVSSSYR